MLDASRSLRLQGRCRQAFAVGPWRHAIVWNAEIADTALWTELHAHFTVPELVELGFFVALTLGQQRWIKTLGIGHGEVLADTTAGLAPSARNPADG